MTTLLVTHPACLDHQPGAGHPERPQRLQAIKQALSADEFAKLVHAEAPQATVEHTTLAHPESYFEALAKAAPEQGLVHLDGDTVMSPGSFKAALYAVGARLLAVDQVMSGASHNAFCAIRPPGHHAERNRPMGFCLFSNIAIAACHARAVHGVERVAVIDFDVHHGNGTQDIFWSDSSLFYGSTHQMPLFPGTGAVSETGVGNICNAPLRAGDQGEQFKAAMRERIFPALMDFSPDLVLISAGFDAHQADPLGGLALVEDDFEWITLKLAEIAHKFAQGRMVSMLEGGYDLKALGDSVATHVSALIQAGE